MKGRAMDKIIFPIVGVMGPSSNGQLIHPGLITSQDSNVVGLIDNSVLADEPKLDSNGNPIVDPAGVPIMTGNKLPMHGLIGRCNIQVFPDLQVPHPVASVALFDSFDSAAACMEAYAVKKLKFVCAYYTQEEVALEKVLSDIRTDLNSQAAQLSSIIAQHFPQDAGSEPLPENHEVLVAGASAALVTARVRQPLETETEYMNRVRAAEAHLQSVRDRATAANNGMDPLANGRQETDAEYRARMEGQSAKGPLGNQVNRTYESGAGSRHTQETDAEYRARIESEQRAGKAAGLRPQDPLETDVEYRARMERERQMRANTAVA
jgi:hypothetical protein